MSKHGIFSDIVGLSYQCNGKVGATTKDCAYFYEDDSVLTFHIGDLLIGKSVGKPLLTILDLTASEANHHNPRLINRARLLFSLSAGQGLEIPITIDDKIRDVINKHASQINLDSSNLSELDAPLTGICNELGLHPKTVSHTRNHLRRYEAGFKVMRDMMIPTRDGNFVLADVYLPLSSTQRYPVLMSCTVYGRRVFYSGPDLEDQDDIAAFEKAEDDWHSTSPDVEIEVPRDPWGPSWASQRGFENIATFNTFTYVPHGYAMVKIDPRGVSQTPGIRNVPGQLSSDFYDAVKWAAEQDWSDGNIALVGSSFGANTQWDVVGMKPKGLKCFVPYATDLDTYREAAYTGGIPASRYLSDWYSRVQACSPKWSDNIDLVKMMNEHPFYDAAWLMAKKNVNHIDTPCFLAAPQIFMIHGRAAYEAWRVRSPANTHLQLVDCDYYSWPSKQAATKILQFLDHHLKGSEHPKPEPVGIQVRVGYGKWYWRKEATWPVPGTKYVKWYLTTDGKLVTNQKEEPETSFSYSSRAPAMGKSGISFFSSPFDEDVDLVGHFSASLNISSSAADADVFVTLWAVDEMGHIVPLSSKCQPEPIAKGFLRASHRKTDPAQSLPERPWHTHTEADSRPLHPGEIVLIDVEIYPAAAKIRKGWRLRVDITPSEEQPDIEGYVKPDVRVTYGETHDRETDRSHVGGGLVNYVMCPVVPCKSYPNTDI